jgi:hypothetical protein
MSIIVQLLYFRVKEPFPARHFVISSFVFMHIVGSIFIFNISRGKAPHLSDLMTTFVSRHTWPQTGSFHPLGADSLQSIADSWPQAPYYRPQSPSSELRILPAARPDSPRSFLVCGLETWKLSGISPAATRFERRSALDRRYSGQALLAQCLRGQSSPLFGHCQVNYYRRAYR